MKIHGLNKLTLLDYPGHMAATCFLGSCNYRCPFCHNASLVVNPESQAKISEDEFFDLLKRRQGMLEGVCITGGEPTLQADLVDFIKRIKSFGYAVKLDTNGSNPAMLKELVNDKLLDYVAIDIKNSFDDYSKTVGIENYDTTKVEESVDFLINGTMDYEFRTTVVNPLHDEDSFRKIGERLKGARAYYLQQFIDSGNLINSKGLSAYDKKTLEKFSLILSKYIDNVNIRGL